MSVHGVGIVAICISLTISAYAGDPFLDAKDDKPVSANFRGTEWNDEFPEHDIPHDIPLTARVITTRIAKMPWGAIFKIEFTDVKSQAPEEHEIPEPRYFIVTDDRIVLLNEEDNEAAAKKISAMENPPEFEPNNIYGITTGKFSHKEGLWEATIELKGNLCVYLDEHPSGHFTKIVWKKGVGLIEYAMGYGAGREGFRLKRSTPKKS
jgi:hypothetical protein